MYKKWVKYLGYLLVYFAVAVVGRSESRTLPKARGVQERKAPERCWRIHKAQDF